MPFRILAKIHEKIKKSKAINDSSLSYFVREIPKHIRAENVFLEILVLVVYLFIVTIFSIVFYLLIYNFFVPYSGRSWSLFFDFRSSEPRAVIDFEKGNPYFSFSRGAKYDIHVDISMPDPLFAESRGMFMLTLDFLDKSDQVVWSTSRPFTPRYKSSVTKVIRALLFCVPMVMGWYEEQQHMLLSFNTEDFPLAVKSLAGVATKAAVSLSRTDLDIYQATLSIQPVVGRIGSFLQGHFYLCFLVVFMCILVSALALYTMVQFFRISFFARTTYLSAMETKERVKRIEYAAPRGAVPLRADIPLGAPRRSPSPRSLPRPAPASIVRPPSIAGVGLQEEDENENERIDLPPSSSPPLQTRGQPSLLSAEELVALTNETVFGEKPKKKKGGVSAAGLMPFNLPLPRALSRDRTEGPKKATTTESSRVENQPASQNQNRLDAGVAQAQPRDLGGGPSRVQPPTVGGGEQQRGRTAERVRQSSSSSGTSRRSSGSDRQLGPQPPTAPSTAPTRRSKPKRKNVGNGSTSGAGGSATNAELTQEGQTRQMQQQNDQSERSLLVENEARQDNRENEQEPIQVDRQGENREYLSSRERDVESDGGVESLDLPENYDRVGGGSSAAGQTSKKALRKRRRGAPAQQQQEQRTSEEEVEERPKTLAPALVKVIQFVFGSKKKSE